MNERKMNLGKIAMVGGMIAMTAMLSAIMMTGCGCQQRTEKTVSTADSAATADSAPKPTYSEEEQAVLDENLSIDASGNVVDCSGKQLKVDDDGKVEVKKSDGTVIKVDADTVRKTIEKQKTEDSGSSVAPTQLCSNLLHLNSRRRPNQRQILRFSRQIRNQLRLKLRNQSRQALSLRKRLSPQRRIHTRGKHITKRNMSIFSTLRRRNASKSLTVKRIPMRNLFMSKNGR